MNQKFHVFIPKNEEAKRYYKKGIDKGDFFHYAMTEKEFDILWHHHVFDILNEKYGLLIDECEEETVTAEQLKGVYHSLFPIEGEWKKAVDHIISLGTCGYLHF